MKDFILAIETGGTKLQLAIGLPDGTILFNYRQKIVKERGRQGVLEAIAEAMPLLHQRAAELGGRLTRVGVGFGGPVETAKGRAIAAVQIAGWFNFPVGEHIQALTGLPTYVFNDTNSAAWGEYCRGAGQGTKTFFYTNMGSGVGGGIIINGSLYDGQGFGAAEFGQTWIGSPWIEANYHNERVENLCSGWAIERRMRAMELPKTSLLWELCGGSQQLLNCEMLGQAAARGDPCANEILDTTARIFSIALANAVSFFSPEKLAIGGGVSLIGEPLIARLQNYTKEYVFFNSEGKFQVVQSVLGEDVVLVGALLLAGSR